MNTLKKKVTPKKKTNGYLFLRLTKDSRDWLEAVANQGGIKISKTRMVETIFQTLKKEPALYKKLLARSVSLYKNF